MGGRVTTNDTAPETVLRLAVLLQAGVTPARAWQHLAESGDAVAGRVHAAVESGMPLSAAITRAGVDEPVRPAKHRARRSGVVAQQKRSADWRDIGAAWHVATTVGAPLAESLRGLALTLRDAQEAADDVRVALAEPAATARLMGWLPLIAVLLGLSLGFDTLGTLIGDPLGVACLVAGIVLILAGRRWNALLVRRATAETGMPGLAPELLAIALSSGVSIERARSIVTEAAYPGDPPAQQEDTSAILALSRSAGVPAVELLRASSALARHRARIDGRLRAARLSSRLLLPLGICTLPAFLLLGVAPMLLSVMSAVPLPI